MTAPPRSRASARIASRYPPNQSAPPISPSVPRAIPGGGRLARSAPCVSLIPTMVSRLARSGCGSACAEALAEARTRRSGRRRTDVLYIRVMRADTGYACGMRAGAAVSRAEDVRLAARDAATRALDSAGLDEAA